jgi:hypothetical protein
MASSPGARFLNAALRLGGVGRALVLHRLLVALGGSAPFAFALFPLLALPLLALLGLRLLPLGLAVQSLRVGKNAGVLVVSGLGGKTLQGGKRRDFIGRLRGGLSGLQLSTLGMQFGVLGLQPDALFVAA